MQRNIDLSIVIPSFNSGEYIRNCIDTLITEINQQDKKNEIEIVVINDGSTDDTETIVNSFGSKVKSYYQENKGLSGARNTGIEKALGRYIWFFDADDYIEHGALAFILKTIITNELDVICFESHIVDNKGVVSGFGSVQPLSSNKIYSGHEAFIGGYKPSSVCVKLFNREFLNRHQIMFFPKISHQDVEFMVRIMLLAKKVKFVKKVIYNYIYNENSISKSINLNKKSKYLKDNLIVAELVMANIDDKPGNEEINNELLRFSNSIVWNLCWELCSKSYMKELKLDVFNALLHSSVYPMSQPLKTKFQKLTYLFFNVSKLLKILLKVKS